LKRLPINQIIDYIYTSLDIIINLKVEEKLATLETTKTKESESDFESLEKLCIDLEGSIRNHIKVIQPFIYR